LKTSKYINLKYKIKKLKIFKNTFQKYQPLLYFRIGGCPAQFHNKSFDRSKHLFRGFTFDGFPLKKP